MSAYYGLELIFHIVDKDITKNSDVLLIFVHWLLSKEGFNCIGLGESETITGDEPTSDVPPEGWNKQDTYAIRYVKDGGLYILRGVKSDDDLVLNLVRVSDLEVASVAINVTESVKALKGKIDEMIPNHAEVMSTLKKDLVDPLHLKTSKSATTQTNKDDSSARSDRQSIPSNPSSNIFPDPIRDPFRNPIRDPLLDPLRDPLAAPMRDPWRDPLRVGQSDLHPFSGGGGMIFDPFSGPSRPDFSGGLPRGSVPPGARFDPIGPPSLNRFPPRRPGGSGPGPDHLPPPGGFDHMFM